MQGYFARLADRASMSDAPSLMAATPAPMADPFGDAQTAEAAWPAPRATAGAAPIPVTTERVVERTRVVHESSETIAHVTLDALSPRPQAPASAAPVEPAETQSTVIETRVPLPVPQRLVPEVKPHPERSESRADESVAASPKETTPEADDPRAEEIRLLRRADSFMEQIVGRRHAPAPERDAIEHHPRSRESTPEPAVPQSRLQPPQPQPRAREHEQERTTLTIGRLTVEVVPPPSAPPAPQPTQIVVVRGARAGRSGIPSSRRFGLRQF